MSRDCDKLLKQINALHQVLRIHDLSAMNLMALILKLEVVYQQYILAMSKDDSICYAGFFTSIDIMDEDLKYLHEKFKRTYARKN